MATIKQIQANRRNSKLSTGPASPEGKAVSRMNALKTGIDAQSEIKAEIWNRSTSEHAANLFKWGEKAEKYPLGAAFQDKQKVFDRLQHRISAAERSLRASLDTLARLRKQSGTGLSGRASGAGARRSVPAFACQFHTPAAGR